MLGPWAEARKVRPVVLYEGGNVLRLADADDQLVPAVGHDDAGAEEVHPGLDAEGGNVALRRVSQMSHEQVPQPPVSPAPPSSARALLPSSP